MSMQDSRDVEDVKVMLVKGADGDTIESINKTNTVGQVDTYTITLTNGTKSTFTVTNGKDGNNISNITKTGTSGLVDTYTVTLTDGSTTNFTVTNGNGIESIEKTSTSGLVDTYTITLTSGDTATFNVTNGETVNIPALKQEIFNTIYPVGAVYITFDTANPSTIFGGTWEKVEGKFLLGSSSSHALNSTGGEETHTLSESEMPIHSHTGETNTGWTNAMRIVSGAGDSHSANHMTGYVSSAFSDITDTGDFPGGNHWHSFTTDTTGGGQSHNNMPPFIAVNIWKRTA